MNITDLTLLATYLIAISVAAERCVEITKNALQLGEKIKNEKIRLAVYHSLAALFSVAIILGGATPPVKTLPFYVLALMASAGSGVWNTVLSMLTSMKTKVAAPTLTAPIAGP